VRVETEDAPPEVRGGKRSGRVADGLPLLGGSGALLSGLLFLVTVLYTFVYLARLGLSTDMLDQPHGLLPWIATNEGVYLGLWWICLASLLCLLPVMPTLYWSTPATGSAIALVGAIAGLAGVVIGIVGGRRTRRARPCWDWRTRRRTKVCALSWWCSASFSGPCNCLEDVLRCASGTSAVGHGAGLDGDRPARRRARGGALVVLSATITVMVASKSVGFFDLEPYLGLLTAVAYLWIGTILLREG
jgi:hypothetical protein